MIVTTGNDVSGWSVTEYLGVVLGIAVRSPTVRQGITMGWKNLTGGTTDSYAESCEVARESAFHRMAQRAEELGANAIIAMRYDAVEYTLGATEVLAYGTAVKIART